MKSIPEAGLRVIQERSSSNVPQVSYTRSTDLSGSLEGAGGIGGLLARSHGYSGGNWSTHNYYHADGNGNITYMVNGSQGLAAKYRYDPYGNAISSSGSLANANVYRFSSKELHSTSGLYYYGYRWYHPNLQRWPNRDPLEELGHKLLRGSTPLDDAAREGWEVEDSPQLDDLNDYRFVGNDPIASVDHFGLQRRTGPCNAKQRQQCIGKCKKDKKIMLSCQRITYTINIPIRGRRVPITFSRTVCLCCDPKERQPLPPPPKE